MFRLQQVCELSNFYHLANDFFAMIVCSIKIVFRSFWFTSGHEKKQNLGHFSLGVLKLNLDDYVRMNQYLRK